MNKNRILSIIGLCMIFLPIVAAAILVISVVIWRVYLMAGWLGIIGLIGTAIYFILAIYLLNRNDDKTRRYGKSAI